MKVISKRLGELNRKEKAAIDKPVTTVDDRSLIPQGNSGNLAKICDMTLSCLEGKNMGCLYCNFTVAEDYSNGRYQQSYLPQFKRNFQTDNSSSWPGQEQTGSPRIRVRHDSPCKNHLYADDSQMFISSPKLPTRIQLPVDNWTSRCT